MKLSKSLIATVLVLCMLLSAIPVFGGTINVPITEFFVPEEGLELKCAASGTDGYNLKFVLSSADVQALGISHSYTDETFVNASNSVYDGLVLSGTIAVPDDKVSADMKEGTGAGNPAVTHITFTNIPLTRVSYRKNNGLSFGIERADLWDPQYISDVKVWDTEAGTSVPYTGTLTQSNFKNTVKNTWYDGMYVNMTSFRVDRGTWNGVHKFNTGVFPDGTMFITTKNLTRTVLTTENDATTAGLSVRMNAKGDFGVYMPQKTGDYYIYALRHHYSGGDGARGSKFALAKATVTNNQISDNTVGYEFVGSTGASSAEGHSFFWLADKNHSKTTLTEGVPFLIRRHQLNSYDRLAAIALVPAKADGTDPMLDITDSTWTYANLPTQADLEFMEKHTAPKLNVGSVTVTVNGVETVVPVMAARQNGHDYDKAPWISKYDQKGHAIYGATVIDALVTATSPVADNEDGYMPYDITTDNITNGAAPSKYAILLNGKSCYKADQTLIKDGDVIETRAFDFTNFTPVVAGLPGYGGHIISNLSHAGAPGLQYQVNYTNLMTAIPGAFAEGDARSNLDGCMLTGYLVPRITTRWTNIAPNLDATSRIYYDGINLYFRNKNGDNTDSYYYAYEEDKDKVKNYASAADVLLENNTKHHPYRVTSQPGNMSYDYSGAALWFANKLTTNELKLDKGDVSGRFVLTTDGSKLFNLFKITYNEDGSIKQSEIEEVYITWQKGYVDEVEENQVIYVWGTKALEGTTMQALMQPITLN